MNVIFCNYIVVVQIVHKQEHFDYKIFIIYNNSTTTCTICETIFINNI